MIVRINQLDAARAEQEAGWGTGGPTGAIRPAGLAGARAFELLVREYDEAGRPLPGAFRQSQMRQMIPQAVAALREPGEELVVRLDGPLADGELIPATRWLTEADGRGRFALSGVQKLDDRALDVPGSLRLQSSLTRLGGLCADPEIGLARSVRLRAFLIPEPWVGPLLTIASVDDPRWDDALRHAGLVLSTTKGLRSLHLYTHHFDAAAVKSRIMQRLMTVASTAGAVR